jgi:hypothetical protein
MALEEYVRFHADLTHVNLREYPVRFFFPAAPDVFTPFVVEHFCREPNLYKEDVGTFLIIVDILRRLSVDEPADADLFVLPLNLASHASAPSDVLQRTLSSIRDLQARFRKRLVLFSCSDFNHRAYRRSTRFERSQFPERRVFMDSTMFPKWIADDDLVICFESTVDTCLRDLTIFPLVMMEAVRPQDNANQHLFGFAGEYSKAHWPEGFVRSPSHQQDWETLKRNPNGAILTSREARAQFEQPFYEFPRRCTFTICPRGIANWTFRLYEAILAGSIPVILSDYFVRPFSRHISWDLFSITVPESDLPTLPQMLALISTKNVNCLKRHLAAAQAHFTADGLIDGLLLELANRSAEAW